MNIKFLKNEEKFVNFPGAYKVLFGNLLIYLYTDESEIMIPVDQGDIFLIDEDGAYIKSKNLTEIKKTDEQPSFDDLKRLLEQMKRLSMKSAKEKVTDTREIIDKFELKHHEIAAYLGISRETFTRFQEFSYKRRN